MASTPLPAAKSSVATSQNKSLAPTEKVLWLLFLLQILLTLCGLAKLLSGTVFELTVTYLPLVLLLLHACWTLSVRRGLAFILLAGCVGFAAEAISLNYGTLFGGDYTYHTTASVLSVPIAVIAYWAIFIYMGYWLTTSFLVWLGRAKPNIKTGRNLPLLGLLILTDGLAVVAIDLFMDPISIRAGTWTWAGGGPYFGVPLGNFVGWFGVAVIVTGIFRVFEYYKPGQQAGLSKSVALIPVLGYLLTGVTFLVGAITYDLPWLAAIGTTIVIMPAVINLILYTGFAKKYLRR